MTQSSPERISVRLPCEFPAEITFSGGGNKITKKATITNISTTGIQILSPSFVATGQTITAAFKVPGRAKKAFRAEVMRIESLQGRMIGHFPYALGAKFIDQPHKQEKQITNFISGKITCAPERVLATSIFVVLGFAQMGRALLHTIWPASEFAAQDLRGFSSIITGNSITHPILSGILAFGFLASAVLCALNKKLFIRLGIVAAAFQTFLSLITIYLKRGLFSGNSADMLLMTRELSLLGLGLVSIVVCLNVRSKLQKIEKILAAARPSSGPNRPTFTIL